MAQLGKVVAGVGHAGGGHRVCLGGHALIRCYSCWVGFGMHL